MGPPPMNQMNYFVNEGELGSWRGKSLKITNKKYKYIILLYFNVSFTPVSRENWCSGSYCQAVGFLVIKDDSISERRG